MSTEVDESFFEGWAAAALAAWHEGEFDALDEFLAEDLVYHQPPMIEVTGLEAYKQYMADVRAAFPDVHVEIEEWIVQGDGTASRGTIRATHLGTSPSMKLPPTGKEINFVWCQYAHLAGGKVVEMWSYNDQLTMMQQLGVVSLPEPA